MAWGQASVGFLPVPVRGCPRLEALDASGLGWFDGRQGRGLGTGRDSGGLVAVRGGSGTGRGRFLPVPGVVCSRVWRYSRCKAMPGKAILGDYGENQSLTSQVPAFMKTIAINET